MAIKFLQPVNQEALKYNTDSREGLSFEEIKAMDSELIAQQLRHSSRVGEINRHDIKTFLKSISPDKRKQVQNSLRQNYFLNIKNRLSLFGRHNNGIKYLDRPAGTETTNTREYIQEPATGILIDAYEFAITSASSERFIKTGGVCDCIVLTLYSPSKKTGVMAHVPRRVLPDDPSLATSMQRIMQELSRYGIDANNNDLQARLVGGWPGLSAGLYEQLGQQMKQYGLAVVENSTMVPAVQHLVFDTSNGLLYDVPEITSREPPSLINLPRGALHFFIPDSNF